MAAISSAANVNTGGNQMFDLVMIQTILKSISDSKEGGAPILMIIMMALLPMLQPLAKTIMNFIGEIIRKMLNEMFQSRIQSRLEKALQNGTPLENEIKFERSYDSKKANNQNANANERTDAILFFVSKLPVAQKMIYTDGIHIVNNQVQFEISNDIQFQLTKLDFGGEQGHLNTIAFRIFSYKLDVCQLRLFVDTLLKNYLLDKRNRLGSDLYFFDQHFVPPPPKGISAGGNYQTEHNGVMFTKNLFITNRTLHNVFFEQRTEVLNRLEFFMKRKDWYDQKGIPYTLGFMLHGAPGCGKTSMVKAVANMTGRHIININLGKIKTKKELKELFYDDRIEVMENSEVGPNRQSYIIPVNQRLYVIEDIDCLSGDILKKRDAENDKGNNTQNKDRAQSESNSHSHNELMGYESDNSFAMSYHEIKRERENTHSTPISLLKNKTTNANPNTTTTTTTTESDKDQESELDLSSILNVMDGTLETPGRMIIITSNYPEKLDHAFIRPGRIDMIIEFKKANRLIISDMFRSFYDQQASEEDLNKIQDYKWTPAEVSQILFKHFSNPAQSLHDLANHDPKEYFKFSYFDKNDNKTNDDESTPSQEFEMVDSSESDSESKSESEK